MFNCLCWNHDTTKFGYNKLISLSHRTLLKRGFYCSMSYHGHSETLLLACSASTSLIGHRQKCCHSKPGSWILPVCPFYLPVQLPHPHPLGMGGSGLRLMISGILPLQLHCLLLVFPLNSSLPKILQPLPTKKKKKRLMAAKGVFEILSFYSDFFFFLFVFCRSMYLIFHANTSLNVIFLNSVQTQQPTNFNTMIHTNVHVWKQNTWHCFQQSD